MILYYSGHTYFVQQTANNWVDAANSAIDDYGGYLAQIGSKAENDAVFKFIQRDSKSWSNHYIAPDGGNAEYVWIGATDLAKEGKWEWSDGSKLTYTNWGYGDEPDNYKNQDGVAIGLDKWPYPGGGLGNAGQWNDIDVTNGLYSLVEIEGLIGTTGSDKITGSKLSESFYSAGGADKLFGLGGADKMNGGAGRDQLSGGTGSDTFVYWSETESTTKGADMIHDFSHRQHDRIDLREVIGAKFDFIGIAGFSGEGAEVRFEKGRETTSVFIDADGNGKAEMAITLDGVMNLLAGDFLL